MTTAQTAAWNIYAARVQAIFGEQQKKFAAGDCVPGISITPPTREHVEIVQKAINHAVKEARLDMIDRVLKPTIGLIDGIDNSRTKSEPIKAYRAQLERVYDELHAMRSEAEKGRDEAQDATTGKA